MLEEKTITICVRELGYDRLRSFLYKAIWSTAEVEHFLFFSTYGTPKVFLTADFGLRNADSQSFGARSVQVYGNEAYHLVARDERKQCYMRFPLGKLAGWNPRWSLNLSRMSDVELAESIRRAVRDRLFPVIRNVTNINQLMSLLMSDGEPVRWIHVNGAMRMAQIAFLARKLDVGVIEIRAMLQRRADEIRAHLRGGTLEPASYIDHIVEDAKRAVLATKDFSSR